MMSKSMIAVGRNTGDGDYDDNYDKYDNDDNDDDYCNDDDDDDNLLKAKGQWV